MGEDGSESVKRPGDPAPPTRQGQKWGRGTGGLSRAGLTVRRLRPNRSAEALPRPAPSCRPIATHAAAVRGRYWGGRGGSRAGGAAAPGFGCGCRRLRLLSVSRRPAAMAVLAALLRCSARGRGRLLQRLLQVKGARARVAARRHPWLGGLPLAVLGVRGVGRGPARGSPPEPRTRTRARAPLPGTCACRAFSGPPPARCSLARRWHGARTSAARRAQSGSCLAGSPRRPPSPGFRSRRASARALGHRRACGREAGGGKMPRSDAA